MKILLLARCLAPDRTSEGICSAKFASILRETQHEIVCLTGESAYDQLGARFELPWLPGVPIEHVSAFPGDARWRALAGRVRKSGGRPTRRLGVAFACASGYWPEHWFEVSRWRQGIRALVQRELPDLLIIRSAGRQLEAHHAAWSLRRWLPLPWVANYHDPYPISLYPEPYRQRFPLMSARQERLHRRVVRAASALTFPSQRLREWVLRGPLEACREKAFVLPHLACDLPPDSMRAPEGRVPAFPETDFVLTHAGKLLGKRASGALLAAFREFLARDPERRARARLLLVGSGALPSPTQEPWADLLAAGNLVCVEARVGYAEALDVSRRSAATVVLEADAPESPFFPGKLADCLWLRQPVLALSPERSVVVDLLGADYPLWAPPDDPARIGAALERLWDAWREGQLEALRPPESVVEEISPPAVRRGLEEVFARAGAPPAAGVEHPAGGLARSGAPGGRMEGG